MKRGIFLHVIRRFFVLALGALASAGVHAAAIGPFDGELSPAPPRTGDTLQLDLSSASSCVAPLPASIQVQRAAGDLEVLVGSGDSCLHGAPAESRTYALGVVEHGIERIVVYSCEGNPPPGAPRCRTAFGVATAGAVAGQVVQSVPAASPGHLTALGAALLLAGIVAGRRTAPS
jgi:hypothetical protein